MNVSALVDIVMEGMSDRFMATYKRPFEAKDIKVVMYAGGLHERYGLKKLTEAFMMLPQENFRLKLFGSGPLLKTKNKIYKEGLTYSIYGSCSECRSGGCRIRCFFAC